jgi:rfaE bifunctional protein nucleotidyltransferase chain/domain
MSTQKIKTLEEIIAIRSRLKEAGRKFVLALGAFDILHAGYVRCLNEARMQGDALIVGIYGDRSIQEQKGSAYPMVPEMERAEVIAALSSVDYIFIYEDAVHKQILASLVPDLSIKSEERQWNETVSTDAIIEKVLKEFGKTGTSH